MYPESFGLYLSVISTERMVCLGFSFPIYIKYFWVFIYGVFIAGDIGAMLIFLLFCLKFHFLIPAF